jgi:AcrR family transcriptional regulator
VVKKRGRPGGEETRQRIIESALATLKSEGFAEASSRAIARTGNFNPALIFYHFGSLDELLLAALDSTSRARLERYRESIRDADTIEELVGAAAAVYEEDRDSGHMAVVAQMIAASIAKPELAPAMVERMEPWIDLAEEALTKVKERVDTSELVPVRELAYVFVTFYLGVNLLSHLDKDGKRTDALFARLRELAPMLALLERRGPGRE